jgi:hypothetical protein
MNYPSTCLLSNLLLDLVSAAPNGGRIVFSTSGLHETTPLHNIDGMRQQLSLLQQQQQQQQHEQQRQPDAHGGTGDGSMPDGTPYHCKRAYALSKTLMARHCVELQRRRSSSTNKKSALRMALATRRRLDDDSYAAFSFFLKIYCTNSYRIVPKPIEPDCNCEHKGRE